MMSIQANFQEIKANIANAAQGREVKIVGVSKTVPPERIAEAFQAGITIFGENRIQEALPKIQALTGMGIEWHFVGHLQTNKAKDAVRYFSWIHSVDSAKLLHAVENEAAKQGKRVSLLLEVNLGGEESKFGFAEEQLAAGLEASRTVQWATVCGLMIIPPYSEDPQEVRPFFRRMREMRDRFSPEYPAIKELSMGMSHDYVVAV